MRLGDWPGPAIQGPQSPHGWPGLVPVVTGDLDGDGDGAPDTVVAPRADGGAWVFTDTDGDGLADQLLDLAPPPDDPDDDSGPLAFLTRWLTG